MEFFTSDEHYGHANMIQYMKRPYENITDQTKKLIANFNSKVGKNDHTWHLGDIFWQSVGTKDAADILHSLNGEHSLIWGNHDKLVEGSAYLQGLFREIASLKIINSAKHPTLVLCHYAMRVWPNSHRGAWHLYGHSHGELPGEGLSFDVGVDSPECKLYPLSLDEVREKMSTRKSNHIIAKAWPGKALPTEAASA